MPKNISLNLSRRVFLKRAASASGAVLLGQAYGNELHDVVDPRVAKVMAGTVSIDMHNHVYPAGTEPRPQQGPKLLIAEELKRSGLTAVCASYVLDFAPTLKLGDARATYLHWLAAVDGELEKGHVRRALTLDDLQAAHRHGHPVIVQTVEGTHASRSRNHPRGRKLGRKVLSSCL